MNTALQQRRADVTRREARYTITQAIEDLLHNRSHLQQSCRLLLIKTLRAASFWRSERTECEFLHRLYLSAWLSNHFRRFYVVKGMTTCAISEHQSCSQPKSQDFVSSLLPSVSIKLRYQTLSASRISCCDVIDGVVQ